MLSIKQIRLIGLVLAVHQAAVWYLTQRQFRLLTAETESIIDFARQPSVRKQSFQRLPKDGPNKAPRSVMETATRTTIDDTENMRTQQEETTRIQREILHDLQQNAKARTQE